MFLKCTGNRPSDDSIGYYKVVESYRDEDNKVKHKILLNLGPISHEKAEKLKTLLEAYREPELICSSLEDILVTEHIKYLEVALLYQLLKKWGLDKLFSDFKFVVPMIINRCLEPQSKIRVTSWVDRTILPQLLDTGYAKVNPYAIYSELDQINDMETKIQKHLFQKLDDDSQALFYDITSTYFEGESCILCARGYSRDHRPDKKQIVIALVINEKGYPFYWKVLPGNTQDVTTLVDLAKTLKQDFGLKKCTLIFDRGMVSQDNLDFLDEKELDFVTALDKDQIKTLELFDFSLFKEFDPDQEIENQLTGFQKYDEDMYYQEKQRDGIRYILGFNQAMHQDQKEAFQKKLEKTLDFFKEKNQNLAQAKRSRNRDRLKNQLDRKLKKKNLHKIISYQLLDKKIEVNRKDGSSRTVNSFKIKTEINEEELKKVVSLFGLSCFITKIKRDDLKAFRVIASYRSKYLIEQSFKVIKNMVKLRPVYLTMEERVKAHVTICMISYFLLMEMENTLKSSQLELSSSEALEELSDCQVSKIKIENLDKQIRRLTTPTELQKKLVEVFDCKKLLKKNYYGKLLEKMDN